MIERHLTDLYVYYICYHILCDSMVLSDVEDCLSQKTLQYAFLPLNNLELQEGISDTIILEIFIHISLVDFDQKPKKLYSCYEISFVPVVVDLHLLQYRRTEAQKLVIQQRNKSTNILQDRFVQG